MLNGGNHSLLPPISKRRFRWRRCCCNAVVLFISLMPFVFCGRWWMAPAVAGILTNHGRHRAGPILVLREHRENEAQHAETAAAEIDQVEVIVDVEVRDDSRESK